jgi:hypothetical protein
MPTPPPNQLKVLNKALILLGSGRRLATADETDSDDARDLIALWDIARRAALELHPWNFAITRVKIAREADWEPVGNGPAYRFKLPVGTCLRWLPWDRDNADWFDAIEEGGYLLSDEAGPIICRHIFDQDDMSLWSPLFLDVMSYTLAIEYCQGKTQLSGVRDRLTRERLERLEEAYRTDGAKSPNRPAGPSVVQSRWAGARFRPNGLG